MLLLFLGFKQRVPDCETEGIADRKARRTYLFGVPCGFTRSDRSMAVWDEKRQAWRLMVDDGWYPQLFGTKDAALAAGRKAEQARDAYAKSAAAREVERRIAWMRTPDVQAWAEQSRARDDEDDYAYRTQRGSW